jgi:hypothetical protein
MGIVPGALEYFPHNLEIGQRLADDDVKDVQAQRDQAKSFETLGDGTLRLGSALRALDYFRQSLDIRHRLAAADVNGNPCEGASDHWGSQLCPQSTRD